MLLVLCLATLAAGFPLEDAGDQELSLEYLRQLRFNSSYIVAGTLAANCEFPSTVSLYITMNGKGYLCGGTLIDSKHVITAAHCVASGVTRVKVGIGSLYVGRPKVVDYASMVVPHNGFYMNMQALHNDVAMLTLRSPVAFTNCIQPSPLARSTDNYTGSTCVTAGWGKTGWTSPISPALMKVKLPIMSYKECHSHYPYIKHEHICAGDWIPGGASPCQGDSGGPLLCQSNGKWVLAGLVSFSTQCEYGPSIYTSVAYFRSWIDTHH